QQLRMNMGNQLLALFEPSINHPALARSDLEFEAILQRALQAMEKTEAHDAFLEVQRRHEAFRATTGDALPARVSLNDGSALSQAYLARRGSLIDLQQSSLDILRDETARGQQHALLIASLLGLVGLGVVLIGYVTASGLARRFSQPIESLAEAADLISHGNFN